MFSVKTNPMIEECTNLERQVFDIRYQMSELEQVRRMLGSLSGMDGIISRLGQKAADMDNEHMIMRQMMQGLSKISIYYMNCENRICDNCEQGVVHYYRQEVGVTDLSSVTNMLQGITLE